MTESTNESERYLVFEVGGALYGTPLLGVREVIEHQAPKAVPGTLPHFLGVINVRGAIVGVIDLRLRLAPGATFPEGAQPAMMIFQVDAGPLAAVVDRVSAVAAIPEGDIERRPNVQTAFPAEFLAGIARHKLGLITLVDLTKLLGSEEVAPAA